MVLVLLKNKILKGSGELGIFAFLKTQPVGFTSGSERFKEGQQPKQTIPGKLNYCLKFYRAWQL